MRRTIEYFVLLFFIFAISLFFFLRIDTSDNIDKTIDSSKILALSDTSVSKAESGDIAFNFVLGDSEKNSENSFKYIVERIKLSYVEDVDEKKLYDGALKGMLSSLDPHSSYLTDKEFKEMQIQTKGEFGGLGIVVTKDSNFIKVVSPIDGTPAFKAGIKTGDYISEINGKNTFDMSLTDAVELMRGKVGEKVKIIVLRKKETKRKIIVQKKVLFFGTPSIAKSLLDELIKSDVKIVGVFCQPDREFDRNKNIIFSPVKKTCLENNIDCFQPENINDSYDLIKKMEPDIILTCAYGQFISERILNIPKYGAINFHASLLPKLRGGAPIH